MKYFFINLDSCVDRREFVFENFKNTSSGEKRIDRVSAVDIEHIINDGVSGTIRQNEKACYLSHYKAIQSSLVHNDHIFIAEDDVLFCDQSTLVIEKVINSIDTDSWDIMYTDTCFPHIDSMMNLFSKRRQFDIDGKFHLLNLLNFRYCGATAYIINSASKQKILDLLPTNELSFAFDISLRQLIHNKKIRGLSLFPFATSLSKYAENSQIQEGEDLLSDLLFNTYRRLVWLGRDIESVLTYTRQIDDSLYDEDSDAFCALLRAILSKNFKTK